MDLPPILTVAGPFFSDIDHCQVQHFQKAVIRWEYSLGFRYFPKLAVEPFDGVSRIDQTADGFRILEIRGQNWPFLLPGFVDFGIFDVPFLAEFLQIGRAVVSSGAEYTAFRSAISFFRSL